MTVKRKQSLIHFRLETKLIEKLDKRIARAGYPSRSEFFTAVAYAALYGSKPENGEQNKEQCTNVEKLPENVKDWLGKTLPSLTEEEIRNELHAVIRDMLFAAIAMKGVDVAYENTWETVRDVFHDRTDIWATQSDIREAFESFSIINKCTLDRYREEQLTNRDEL